MNFQRLDYLDLEISNHRKTKLNLTEKIKISCNIEHLENKFITYSTHYQYSTKLHS